MSAEEFPPRFPSISIHLDDLSERLHTVPIPEGIDLGLRDEVRIFIPSEWKVGTAVVAGVNRSENLCHLQVDLGSLHDPEED